MSETHDTEIRRMLLWFRSTLPEHDLGEWHVWLKPYTVPLTDERRSVISMQGVGLGHAAASCRCSRCGRSWSTEDASHLGGSSWVGDNSRETYDRVIEAAKVTLRKRVERDNQCWGDIPPLPRDCSEGFAVMDSSSVGAGA